MYARTRRLPAPRTEHGVGRSGSMLQLGFTAADIIALPPLLEEWAPEPTSELLLELRVSVFHCESRTFSGRTWVSPARAVARDQLDAVDFEMELDDDDDDDDDDDEQPPIQAYYMLPARYCDDDRDDGSEADSVAGYPRPGGADEPDDAVAVVELVGSVSRGASIRRAGLGWCLLRLSPDEPSHRHHDHDHDQDHERPPPTRVYLHRGTPRMLVAYGVEGLDREPSSGTSLLVFRWIDRDLARLADHLAPHAIIGDSDPLPGFSTDAGQVACIGAWAKGSIDLHPCPVAAVAVQNVSVVVPHSLVEFEECFRQDVASGFPCPCPVSMIHVVHRRITMAVHNGSKLVGEPCTAELSFDRSRSSNTASFSGSLQTSVCMHPSYALLFQLEYELSAPEVFASAEASDQRTAALAKYRTDRRQAINVVTRWVPVVPAARHDGGHEPVPISVEMRQGPFLLPCGDPVLAGFDIESGHPGVVQFQCTMVCDVGRAVGTTLMRSPSPAGSPVMSPAPFSQLSMGRTHHSHVASPAESPAPGLNLASPRYEDMVASTGRLGLSGVADAHWGTGGSALGRGPGTQLHGAPRTVQAELSRVQWAEIIEPGDTDDWVDPHSLGPGPGALNPELEQADPLQGYKVSLQLMAFQFMYEPTVDTGAPAVPRQLYFTFRFFRFPSFHSLPMRLHRAAGKGEFSSDFAALSGTTCLLEHEGHFGHVVRFSTKQLIEDGDCSSEEFFAYLARQTCSIELWDSETQMLVGTAELDLRTLLRGGNPAIVAYPQLDVVAARAFQVSPHTGGAIDTAGGWVEHPSWQVPATTVGTLSLRVAAVGQRCRATLPRSTANAMTLSSRLKPYGQDEEQPTRNVVVPLSTPVAELEQTDHERKLSKLVRIRAKRGASAAAAASGPLGTLDSTLLTANVPLGPAATMRRANKDDQIKAMLARAITTAVKAQVQFGTPLFIDFEFTNPRADDATFTIHTNDPELNVVQSVEEWREWKRLLGSAGPIEESLLSPAGKGDHILFLRGQETVMVPIVYRSLQTPMSQTVWGGAADRRRGQTVVASEPPGSTEQSAAKKLQLSFSHSLPGTDGQLSNDQQVAILNLTAAPQLHRVDRVLRFWHAEHDYMNRTVPLPRDVAREAFAQKRFEATVATTADAAADAPSLSQTARSTAGAAGVDARDLVTLAVKCSNPEVVCEYRHHPNGKHQHYVHIRTLFEVPKAPTVTEFTVVVYGDAYGAKPLEVWHIYLHAVARVDISGVLGQQNTVSGQFVVDGGMSACNVRCHTSEPGTLRIAEPHASFRLAAGAVQKVGMLFTPQLVGTQQHLVHVVNADHLGESESALLASFLVVARVDKPVVTQTFNTTIKRNRGHSKRVQYRNPHRTSRRYHVHTNRPDAVECLTTALEIAPGASEPICFRFRPTRVNFSMFVFINDVNGKTEECFAVNVAVERTSDPAKRAAAGAANGWETIA